MKQNQLNACRYCNESDLLIEECPSNDGSMTWFTIHHGPHTPCSVSMLGSNKRKLIAAWNGKPLKWVLFDTNKGSRQKRPPIGKFVLVKSLSAKSMFPNSVSVGYRKDAAGDKQSPYFVTPGVPNRGTITWCDCLPDGFEWPKDGDK